MNILPNARDAASAEKIEQLVDTAVEKAVKRAGSVKGDRKSSQPPKLAYSVAEAARSTSLSRSGIYAALKRGELNFLKKGARSLILAAELERWLLKDQPPTAD
jgi:excisionase family DNA binding protein